MRQQSAFKAAAEGGFAPGGASSAGPTAFSAADLQSAIAVLQQQQQQQQQQAAAAALAAAAAADDSGAFLSGLPGLSSPMGLQPAGGSVSGYLAAATAGLGGTTGVHSHLYGSGGSGPVVHTPTHSTPAHATGGGYYSRGSTGSGSAANSGFYAAAGGGGGGGGANTASSWLSSASTPPASPGPGNMGGGGGGYFTPPHARGGMPPLPSYGTPSRGGGGGYGSFSGRGGPTGPGASAVYDMKSLTAAVNAAAGGTGDIRRIFTSATFRPRLPGLTKLVSQLTREGQWSKGLEVFDALDAVGLLPDTTITNAAISACDKGGQWEKALQIFYAMESWGLSRDAITYSAVISALSKGRQWSLAIDVFNHMCDHNIECDAVTCCSLITALDKGGQWQLGEQVFFQMYADHPQFKVLLQCMDDDVAAVAPSVCSTAATGSGNGASAAAAATPIARTASAAAESLLTALTRPLAASVREQQNDVLAGLEGGLPGTTAGGGLYRTASSAVHPGSMDRIDEESSAAAGGHNLRASVGTKWVGLGGSNEGGAAGGGAAGGSYLDMWDRRAGNRMPQYPHVVIRSPASMSPAAASLQHQQHHATGKEQQLQQQGGNGFGQQSGGPLGGSGGSGAWAGQSAHHLGLEAGGPFGEAQHGGGLYGGPPSPHPGQRGLLRTSSLNTKKSAPNRVCCNALLAAYARASPTQWQRAIRLLELMWQIGGELCPDIVSYNTVIKACGNAGQVELGFKVYALMRRRGIEPTVATYGTLVCIAAEAGAHHRVVEVWGWLRASGLEVHVTCANAYLAALIKLGEWDQAVTFFRSLLRPGGPCRPNAITFNNLMAGYLERRQPEQVPVLFQEMQNGCGLAPSVSSYGHLVAAYGQMGRWEEAVALVAAVCRPESSVRPAVSMFTSLFTSLREAAEAAAAQAAAAAAGGGMDSAAATANAASTLLSLSRHMHDLRGLLKAYPHLHPDPSCHRAMIGAFSAVGEVDVCVELFNVLLLLGQAPAHAHGHGHVPPQSPRAGGYVPPPSPSPYGSMQPPSTPSRGGGGGGMGGLDEHEVHGPYGEAGRGQQAGVDAEVGGWVLHAVCMHRAWDKAVQLLKVLQDHGPQLPAPTLRLLLEAMAADRAWTHAYSVLQIICSSAATVADKEQQAGTGGASPTAATSPSPTDQPSTVAAAASGMATPTTTVLDQLVYDFKEGGHTELLFLALLAAKDEVGAWGEALSMFHWLQEVPRPELSRSKELYRIMYEVLVVRGGVEGLRHAVQMCRDAHENGILSWYTPLLRPPPSSGSSSPGSTSGPTTPTAAAGGRPPGSAPGAPRPASSNLVHVVVLEGASRIETAVTLLSWLLDVKQAAISNGTLLPGPWVDIITPDGSQAHQHHHQHAAAPMGSGGASGSAGGPPSGSLHSLSSGHASPSPGASRGPSSPAPPSPSYAARTAAAPYGTAGGPSLDGEQVRPAVTLVLEGRIGELLGVGEQSEPAHRALFALQRPVRLFPSPVGRPGVVRVETDSVYEAMGLSKQQLAQQQQPRQQ